MITGTISTRRAYVPLRILGPAGQEGEMEFVLDTGLTATATLPPTACAPLGLVTLRIQPVRLADGTRVLLDVYEATLMWAGVPRSIELLAKEGAPLMGMTLLD